MGGARARLLRLATAASLSVAILLALLKLAALLATGSAAILSSMIDSLTDIGASAIVAYSVRLSAKPPDRKHRYGHGKAEPLGAITQGGFVAGSAVLLIIEAGSRLMSPQPVTELGIGIGITIASLAITLALFIFQCFVVHSTGSTAIDADSVNYGGDLLSGGAVLVALLLVDRPGFGWIDPAMAIAIALFLLRNARRIVLRALDSLMDKELPQADRARIEAIVRSDPEVVDMHDLRSRASGATRFVELHVELEGSMTLDAAHDVTDRIEAALAHAFPDIEVILHQEPAGLDDDRLDHRIAGRIAGRHRS